MKNILSINNIRDVWNVAHSNVTGDVGRTAIWIELNHDEIIGLLLSEIERLRKSNEPE